MATTRTRNGEAAEPNLTPILDMVFQLITFFMLVISFKTASMDPGIRLPVVGTARPCGAEAQQQFVVLNIDAAGTLRVYGEACELEPYLAMEAEAIRQAAAKTGNAAGDGEVSMATVIRADRSTSFCDLNRVLTACKKHGFRNVTLKVQGSEGASQRNEVSL
jgi:biopolymer transport protein ExbD